MGRRLRALQDHSQVEVVSFSQVKHMSVVLILALALSAGQIEKIIVDHYPDHEVFQVIPPSHPSVDYEWRIEGLDFSRGIYVNFVGEQILKALGTSEDAKWERGGLWFVGRDPWDDPTGMPEFMAKKDNVGVSWDLETREGRIVVFDPEKMHRTAE